jgi:hypothetical protein
MTAKEYKVVALRDCPGAAPLPATTSFPRADPQPPVRTLQIEADGDRWKGLLKPKIRIVGRWLERAGFKPGQRVRLTCLAPGVIELRSLDPLMAEASRQALDGPF